MAPFIVDRLCVNLVAANLGRRRCARPNVDVRGRRYAPFFRKKVWALAFAWSRRHQRKMSVLRVAAEAIESTVQAGSVAWCRFGEQRSRTSTAGGSASHLRIAFARLIQNPRRMSTAAIFGRCPTRVCKRPLTTYRRRQLHGGYRERNHDRDRGLLSLNARIAS